MQAGGGVCHRRRLSLLKNSKFSPKANQSPVGNIYSKLKTGNYQDRIDYKLSQLEILKPSPTILLKKFQIKRPANWRVFF